MAGVPSFRHEVLVELFRNRGELAAELLRTVGIEIDHVRVELGSIDLSQVASTEYRADAVVVLRDGADRAAAGVIVEIQRTIEREKHLTWPVYVTTLRAKLGCPVVLLVIAPDAKVAAWARRPIDLGHPAFLLTPVVLGFAELPRVRDRAAAHRLPELAVLSVMAHPELEIAEVAIEAISGLPEDQSRLYLDVIMTELPAAIRQHLETQMQGYEYQSEFARKYYSQGREEGRQEGREDGLRAAVLALARTKLDGLTGEEVTAIESLCDPRVLTELVTSLGRAHSAADARATLLAALLSRGYSNSRP